jgi:hypothetical protein
MAIIVPCSCKTEDYVLQIIVPREEPPQVVVGVVVGVDVDMPPTIHAIVDSSDFVE